MNQVQISLNILLAICTLPLVLTSTKLKVKSIKPKGGHQRKGWYCHQKGCNTGMGLPGRDGPMGLTGPSGIQGIQGVPGVQGVQGAHGPHGERGYKGQKGQKGTYCMFER